MTNQQKEAMIMSSQDKDERERERERVCVCAYVRDLLVKAQQRRGGVTGMSQKRTKDGKRGRERREFIWIPIQL